MNYIKQNIVALVALIIAAIALIIIVTVHPTQTTSVRLGAAVTTPTNYNNLTLSNQLIVGGVDSRSDATTTVALGLTDLLGNTTIIETAATSSTMTINLPSTTTLISVLPHIGDYVSYIFVNASTTGPSIIIASSTDASTVVKTATTTTPTLVHGAVATVDCVKIAVAGQINCLVSPSNP